MRRGQNGTCRKYGIWCCTAVPWFRFTIQLLYYMRTAEYRTVIVDTASSERSIITRRRRQQGNSGCFICFQNPEAKPCSCKRCYREITEDRILVFHRITTHLNLFIISSLCRFAASLSPAITTMAPLSQLKACRKYVDLINLISGKWVNWDPLRLIEVCSQVPKVS